MNVRIVPRSIASQWVSISSPCIHSILSLTSLIVLDPRCKLEYFKTAKWEKEWIDEAERLTRQEYNNSYRDLEAEFAEPSIALAAQAEKRVSPSCLY